MSEAKALVPGSKEWREALKFRADTAAACFPAVWARCFAAPEPEPMGAPQ